MLRPYETARACQNVPQESALFSNYFGFYCDSNVIFFILRSFLRENVRLFIFFLNLVNPCSFTAKNAQFLEVLVTFLYFEQMPHFY